MSNIFLSKRIQITLEKPVYGGYCLGFIEGKAVMAPYSVPGETVELDIIDEKRDYCVGSINTIISSSRDRIKPSCPHFGQCGGCSYLHLPYELELDIKKRILKDTLMRIAGLLEEAINPIEIMSGQRFNYRSQADIKVNGKKQGFFRASTNDCIPVQDSGCLLLANEINDWLKNNERTNADFRVAFGASGEIITSFQEHPIVRESERGLWFHRGIMQFFQANRFLRAAMLDIVRDYAALSPGETFLDIDCGVGFFAMHLAAGGAGGTGIDISRESIRWAKDNARLNRINSVEFLTAPSATIHPARFSPGLVVIDPPRAGIDKKTRKTLLAMAPRSLVYVSCNPATFSRDAKDFISGGYRLEKCTLIDMFPGTQHLEIISRFNKDR